MPILITGASGYLGSGLQHNLNNRDHQTIGTFSAHPQPDLLHLDLTQPDEIRSVILAVKPDTIIHCAGLVDECETDRNLAAAVNIDGTRNIVEAAQEIDAKIAFISSAAVFDGIKGTFSENDLPHAASAYGQMKLEAESIVQQGSRNLIIRPSLLIGHAPYGMQPRFFGKMMAAIRNRAAVTLDDTWQFTPSSIEHIAKVLQWWIENNDMVDISLLHVACPETTTKYKLTKEIAASLGKPSDLITPLRSNTEVPKTLLDTQELIRLNAPSVSLREVIGRVKEIEGNISVNRESLG